MKKNALLIIDVQNDFCPDGALAVNAGNEIISLLNSIVHQFDLVVATQDWHPAGHISFASTHKRKTGDKILVNGIEQELWPDHCIQGSHGAALHSALNTDPINMIIRKGLNRHIDSYSGFFENDRKTKTGLMGYLKEMEAGNLYIGGLALDYCVYFSACDAKKMGFNTFVIEDAARGVNIPVNNISYKKNDMKKKGIKIIKHENILQ